jgi:N-acetylglucosaminyldiphosphoundecaprenol N-acetyl-beta-D-mannosaminyltransferase
MRLKQEKAVEASETGEPRYSASRVSLFDMPLDIGTDDQFVVERMESGSLLLSYLNPYAYKAAERMPSYVEDLKRFDLVVCDGLGIQLAAKAVFNIATPILTPDFSGIGRLYLKFAENRGMAMCMVGSDQETIQKAVARISADYPALSALSGYGGYGDSPDEAKKFVMASKPDMILVGMGMGKQERYLLDLAESGWSGIGICVGGFFDKLANPNLEYPAWSEKTRLRFLGRLMREPRRLSRRYFVDYQQFIKMYLMHVLNR